MSKDNKTLAKKIIEQLATVTEVEAFDTEQVVQELDDGGKTTEAKTTKSEHNAYSFAVPALGIQPMTFDGPKQYATDQATKNLTSLFDSGAIVLSDTWAEDNLKAS